MGDSFDDDDTPTPRDRPGLHESTPTSLRRRHMSDTDRALAGAAHRRTETDSESRRRANPYGVPLADPVLRDLGNPDSGPLHEHEITSPIELLNRDLSQAELDVVHRSKRNSGDPATYADVVKLAERLINREREDRSNREGQANQLMELLGRPPHEAVRQLQADVAELKESAGAAVVSVEALTRWWRPIRAVMIFLAIAAFGGLGFFVDQLLVHAESKTEAAIKIDHIERALIDLRQDLRDLRDDRAARHYSPEPDRAWLKQPSSQPAPKDTP